MEFSEEFFKKEIKYGFEVPEMMKRAWAAELEVLKVVIDICERNGIQYFAEWGTLLGAVRHKGFIPWDDDIDICLKRNDYNRLINLLPSELPYGFVISGMYAQCERLRKAAYVPQLRVIADETLWDFNDYMKYFHGFPYQRIGIDIFPLDYIHKEPELANIQKIMVQQAMIILRDWDILKKNGELTYVLNKYEKLCGVSIDTKIDANNYLWKLVDKISSLYNEEESEYMTTYTSWIKMEEFKLRKEWLNEAILLPFENIKISAPSMYDEVLKVQFGDYMTPLIGTATHDYPFYGHMQIELEKQIKAVGFNGSVEKFCEEVSSGRLRV